MRGKFGPLALLVATGSLFAAPALDAQAVGGLNTITVSPAHGRVTAPFQLTYVITPCTSAAGLTIGFSWSALAPAGQVLGTAATDNACRATISTAPPAKPAPGVYQVFGYVALPTGAPTPGTEASASYTIDVTPAPTASASATARPTATSRPSASAPGNTGASPAVSAPFASDQAGTVTPHSTGGNPIVANPRSQPLWWMLEWTAGRRILVIALSILILIVFLAAWLLRRRRTNTAAGRSKDKAA